MPKEDTKSSQAKAMKLDEKVFINKLAVHAISENLSFAFYRMPSSSSFEFIAGKLKKISDDDLAEIGQGFLINSYSGDLYFIEDGIRSNSKLQEVKSLNSEHHVEYLLERETQLDWDPYVVPNPVMGTEREDYTDQVKSSIKEIKQSELIKVVPSRVKRIKLNKNQKPSQIFLDLAANYKTAFVSLISSPEFGTWLGATPESLIEVDHNGVFRTMSLAGTQPYTKDQALHTLPWTQKEIEEQAMVSRYIINRFKEIRLREFEELGPRTVSAGNMAHLCSTFTVDTQAADFPNLGSVMLKLLHPTSAVCGMPKQSAKTLLSKLEKHDRKLFSGYLGPVNTENGSAVYVNLRCMEYQNDEAILYAGAGVTEYSVAEDEWQETELKCNTILNIIAQ
jgi:isochorismate synthase